MAIKAREAGAAAAKLIQESRDELMATEIVLAKLQAEVAELQKMIEECKSGEVSADGLGTDSIVTGTVDMKDLETGEAPTLHDACLLSVELQQPCSSPSPLIA